MEYPHNVVDKQAIYYMKFDHRLRAKLRLLVSDEIIEEHRQRPLGQHSDTLDRLLNYFRRGGMAGKLGLYRPDPEVERFQIVIFSGARGVRSRVEDSETYGSLNEAYHAVFVRRVADLIEN